MVRITSKGVELVSHLRKEIATDLAGILSSTDEEEAAETRIESANWSIARWLKPQEGDPLAPDARPALSLGTALARDSNGWLVALLPSEWALKTFHR